MRPFVILLLICILGLTGYNTWQACESEKRAATQAEELLAQIAHVDERVIALQQHIIRIERDVSALEGASQGIQQDLTGLAESLGNTRSSLSTVSLVLSKMKVRLDEFFRSESARD